jgi:hypothetical protein
VSDGLDRRLRVAARVALAVGALALISVPSAVGAKPTRTLIEAESFVIPAGFGCAFDVEEQVQEGTTVVVTEFSDGRVVTHGNSEPTLVNLDTGTSFVQRTRATVTETYDAEMNDLLVEISGRIFISLFPGDQGPVGEIGENGALLAVVGHQHLTVDLDTDVITSYSLDGQATDLCALLSG